MKVACFLLAFCVAFIYKADCQITAWGNPSILLSADGTGSATPDLDEGVTGGSGITIAATGAAVGAGTYALISQTPTTGGTFTIDSTSGLLSVTGTTDFETTTEYVLVVEATAGDSTTGTATVTVTIADVDEVPVFGATSYAFCINDLAAAGDVLTTLTGTDPESATVTYAITGAGNTNSDFAVVDTASGEITVANPLDKSVTAGYAFALEATEGSNMGSTDVYVYVGSCSGAAALLSGAIITTMTVLVARFL